ncbi:MAG: hypothetical protein IJ348_06775 [Alistipes sp.]|nr:hypothetical protein [Alistipes sp.]
MWQKIGKILLMLTIWAGVIAYVAWSGVRVQRHLESQTIERVDIAIVDSMTTGRLVGAQRVREWLRTEGFATIGAPLSRVDVVGIRDMIARNGFVDNVNVYASYRGTLHIDISQRQPLLRLLVDGYNVYITEEGFVFSTPEASSLYAPVVTGDYKPLFDPAFEGMLSDYMVSLRRASEQKIKEIGKEKKPLWEQDKALKESYDKVGETSIEKYGNEKPSDYRRRLEQFKDDKLRKRLDIEAQRRDVQSRLDAVTARQRAEQQRMQRLQMQYDDLCHLLAFVKQVQRDSFWRAEIVQICATTTSYGALSLSVVPRSGNFSIELGEPKGSSQKLERLMSFYRSAMSSLGWERWSKIDLRYNNQVVCTQ